MSRVAINTGSVANDGTGDSLRIAGGIINDNFGEIYSQFGDGTNLTPTWDKTTAGINTTSSVGIGTTNPRFTLEVGAVGASGTSLWVNGNARVTGILTVGSSSIVLDGNANKILVGSGISFDGNTGIISATAFYAGGSIITGGGGGSVDSYWGSSASGISTTSNVAIGTVTPTSKLTVVGNSLFSGIATFRSNLTLANLTSSSNTLRFGSNSYIDQSNSNVFTFQITSGTDGSGDDSSFVFRTTEPGAFPVPDQAYDALRVYSSGNYWNRLVRVYTNFHADNNVFVGGNLQVGAASTLIGVGNTLGSFKVGAGGTVITTTSTGLVGIGTTNPISALTVKGNTSLETLNVSGVVTATSFIGDGSGLTGVVGSGSGIIIKDNGSAVGTAGTIDFSTNLSVSPISAGVVTVTASGDGGESYWASTAAGIHTLSNVGIGTTNSTSALTVKGNTSLETLNVSGVSTFAGITTVTGPTLFTKQLSVSGVSTFAGITTVTGPTLFTKQLNVSGVSTLGTLRLNSLTNLANLDTSFSNASNIINFGNDLAIFNLNDGTFGNKNWILANEYPLYIGTKGETGGNIFYSSLITIDPGTDTFIPNTSNVKLGYGDNTTKLETIGAGVTVTGTTFTNQLSVSGVSSFSGQSTFNGGIILNGVSSNLSGSQRIILSGGEGLDTNLYNGGIAFSSFIFNSMQGGSTVEVGRLDGSGVINLPLSQGGINVSGISTLGTVQISSGIVTATSGIVTYYGDSSYTTDGRWTLGASGTSDYTFTGIGFTQTTNDPILYLARGRVYEFVNNSGGSHPFQIRVSNGGSAYNDGVTNNGAASGVIRFEIPFNAPNTLYYQCTVHSGMGNTISVYPSTI